MDEQPETDAPQDDVLERALRRFDECSQPQLEMREQSLQARRCISIPGAMWEGEFGDPFENRIRLEIPKIKRGLLKIYTDYQQSRLVPNFRPAGGESDDGTAATMDGVHRADSARFGAQEARDNAFFEAVTGGMGAYRLCNEYDDEYDPDNDHQRINPGALIADADQCVFFDHNSRRYDKADARFAFVVHEYTPDAFTEEHGEDLATDWPDPSWGTHYQFDWFEPDVVRVVEYYEKVEKREKLHIFSNALTEETERFWASDLDDAMRAELLSTGWTETFQRRKRAVVHKYVLTGAEVLEGPTRMPGGNIPIVPVYGHRAFVDGIERFTGYVHDRLDSQRLYNAAVSRIAETFGQSMQDTPIFTPGQVAGHEQLWADRVINRPPYLLINPETDPATGDPIAVGPIGTLSPPNVGPADATLLQIANNDLLEDAQDGADEVKANVSAEAMDVAAARVDARSGPFIDNNRKSVQREGEIYLPMAREIYTEPGRKVETMTEDGGDGTAELFEVYTDPASKEPKVRNDFSRGKYKVVASVTEATATRRDKTVKMALAVAEKAIAVQAMDLATASVLTAIANVDGEGIKELQDFARNKGLQIGLHKPNEDEAKQLEDAAQQPDPNSELIAAQAQALQAQAADAAASAAKKQAEIPLTEAKTIETLAKAQSAANPMDPIVRRGSEMTQ
jgi:Phage P22-like portal protein